MSEEPRGPVLAAISAGGAVGAAARYGISLAAPTTVGDWPWGTFAVNVTGCALMGVLMVLITERFVAPRLVRPFLGVGVLGGYTTFSTATLEGRALLGPHLQLGVGYLVATALGSVAAVVVGMLATRALVGSGGEEA